MAGIYIHIPFCLRKCFYCDFYSIARLEEKDRFLEALSKEIKARKDELGSEIIETVYIGGGTPSVLSVAELASIFCCLAKEFSLSNLKECTIELNPESVDKAFFAALKQDTPINRLSIGVQSFQDEDLARLNRKHTSLQAFKAIENARIYFSNISIDLIYGLPHAEIKSWESNIESFLSLKLPHLSAYALTIENGSVLKKMMDNKKYPPLSEDKIIQAHDILMNRLIEKAYIAYETSNFCLPDFYSNHNQNYWNLTPYIGFGPSAHSFDGRIRKWNPSSLDLYIESSPATSECLNSMDLFNEYIMLALRTIWGVEKDFLRTRFPETLILKFRKEIQAYIQKGYIIETEKAWICTTQGRLFVDGIAASLFN